MKAKITNQKYNFRKIPGIHVQWPWSRLIVSGAKSIETRGYPLLEKYEGVELAIIETAGPRGKKEAGISTARIIGTVKFNKSFKYTSKAKWDADLSKHLVSSTDNKFGYGKRKETWGWVVSEVQEFQNPLPPPTKRGIVFALNCSVPSGQ